MNNIFTYTGNPFVDAGITALLVWSNKDKPEDIDIDDVKNLANEITELYLEKNWNKIMFSIFPNSKITNPSIKDKKDAYKKFLDELIDDIVPIDTDGNCIACGRRSSNKPYTKTQIPLTGSSDFINFFSYGKEGADYCPACVLAIQFAPLVFYKCGNLVCLQSNNSDFLRIYANRCKNSVEDQKASKNYTGCMDEGFFNTVNALFHLASDIILTYDRRNWQDDKTSIRMYHFTNYNQPPIDNLSIYDMPDKIFRFLAYVLQHEEKDNWKRVIKRSYIVTKKINLDNEEEYKNLKNDIYERLLRGNSILKYFIDYGERNVYVGWSLLEYYMKGVRDMDQKRLDAIKKVGDEIALLIKSKNKVKRLTQIENAKTYSDFRNVLRYVIKDRIAEGFEEPLFTLDDYENYLFPDESLSWKETQDLIIFRLYEKLHKWLIESKEIEVSDEEENIDNEEEDIIYE
ncbi:type I-B CRISPR-associated protein Cas8b1/Cst1 [Thermoanaerobacterium sp. RBIITD]|uniref:type I-B CRISPR-associated protein Cas8b1/Cst1 n=1 Tax=Thermoanaerobacterium sp. RBIITD TaxID=1550240 RepID=UPI000BB7C86C|nr:type I-B CRISPR-associated protein Cas8b1/Cst1 [Thermoanaerobacterium sp. RBIITD]SNX53177.1 CRISPR-associated protein, Cst1 family [Thermoanaerobacterium sp. RBIITD]